MAGATLLQRLVYLRLLETNDLCTVPIVTGGWDSRGYKRPIRIRTSRRGSSLSRRFWRMVAYGRDLPEWCNRGLRPHASRQSWKSSRMALDAIPGREIRSLSEEVLVAACCIRCKTINQHQDVGDARMEATCQVVDLCEPSEFHTVLEVLQRAHARQLEVENLGRVVFHQQRLTSGQVARLT